MNKKLRKILIPISVFVVYLGLAGVVFATDYVMLEKIHGIGDSIGKVSDFGAYLSGLFKLSIGVAAVLAILMLSVGGFEYITTEAFSGKGEAKKKITNAVYGLILIISAYLLLQTINPDLVNAPLNIPCVGSNCEKIIQTSKKGKSSAEIDVLGPVEFVNTRPLGNFEENGYTKTKVSSFVDRYEKGRDVFCLNSFTGVETNCGGASGGWDENNSGAGGDW